MLYITLFILVMIGSVYSEEACYRKLGLYGVYPDDSNYRTPLDVKTTTQNYENVIIANAMLLESKINWTIIMSEVNETFAQNCSNSDYLYNGRINETFILTFQSGYVDAYHELLFVEPTSFEMPTNMSIKYANCTNYTTPPATPTPGYGNDSNDTTQLRLSFNESSMIITFNNITVVLNNTCITTSIERVHIRLDNDSLIVIATSYPFSTSPPFIEKEYFNNCTLTLPVFIQQGSKFEKKESNCTVDYDATTNDTLINSTACVNTTFDSTKNITYVYNNETRVVLIEQQNDLFTNITVITEFLNECNASSPETKLYAVGIPNVYNEILTNLSVEITNDTVTYFNCKLIGTGDCGVGIFLERATTMILEEKAKAKAKSNSRHARSVIDLDDAFCLHMRHGLHHDVDCRSRLIPEEKPKPKERSRRSPPKGEKPPVPPKNDLVLMSADELGARPKIRRNTDTIQMGASGVDGPVAGSDQIYTDVKQRLETRIKKLAIDDKSCVLTASRLPPSTKALLEEVIGRKAISTKASKDITLQILNQQQGITGNPMDRLFKVDVQTHTRPSTIINVDTSSRVYANILRTPKNVEVSVSKGVTVVETTVYGSRDDTYLKPRRSSSMSDSDSTYFLQPEDEEVFGTSTQHMNKRRPLRRHSSSDYETIKERQRSVEENYYESVNDHNLYALAGRPTTPRRPNPREGVPLPPIPRKDLPLPPIPGNENPFNTKTKKMIDKICDSQGSASICDIRSSDLLYESVVYDETNTRQLKHNPIYEPFNELEYSANPLYQPLEESKPKSGLTRKNAIRRRPGQGSDTVIIETRYSEGPEQGNDNYDANDVKHSDWRVSNTYSAEPRKGNDNGGGTNTAKDGQGKKVSKTHKKHKKLSMGVYENDKINSMIKAIALSSYVSTTSSRISSIMATAGSQPKELVIVNLLSSVLSQIGGTISITGSNSPTVAVAGLALQGISGLIDAATSIYHILTGSQPYKDPAIEKFSNYANYMSRTEAGARVCMMPDSDITITLAYRHTKMNTDAEKARGEYTDIIPSKVYYLKNNYISYTAKVTLVCPIGQLRLLEADVNAYATLIREETNGGKYYLVHGILELLSYHPTVTFTCGNEPGVIFTPFEQKLKDMQLLRISTPGEPKEAEDMPSNVCDLYPLKRFYVLAGNCPYDMSRKSVAYVTCSTLLRMSTYEHTKHRWILMNPFSKDEHDNIQLFTFKKYDFKDSLINLNEIGYSDTVCSQSDTGTCYWSDAMILEDVTVCTSRIRKLYVKLSTSLGKGYNSFVLTCPYGSTPFYISNGTIVDIPINTRRTTVRFAAQSDTTALVSCIHNTNAAYKSDIIQLTFVTEDTQSNYLDFRYFKYRRRLFETFSDPMPLRSKKCKRYEENRRCRNYYHVKHIPKIDYKVVMQRLPMVKLSTSYTGPLNDKTITKISSYYASPISLSIDVSSLSNVYDVPHHFWKYAKEGVRTFSAIAVTMFGCSVVAGNVNVNPGIGTNSDVYGRNAKYIFLGTKQSPSNNRIAFDFVYDSYYQTTNYPYEKCDVYLDLLTRRLEIRCPELTIPQKPFNSPLVNSLCVLVATSRDHCALVAENWDRTYGYSYSEAYTEFDSCRNEYYPTRPIDNFCYYWHLSTYWPPDYDPCISAMVLAHSYIFPDNKIVNPPYIKEFGYDPDKNEYVDGTLYAKLQTLYEQYNKLVEYSMNPMVGISNNLAAAMTPEAREIFRLEYSGSEMEMEITLNKRKAEKVKGEIEDLLSDIYANTLTYSEATAMLRSAISTRCCVLNGTGVYKYFKLEHYLCGAYDDYLIRIDNKTYVRINETIIPENEYLTTKIPRVTCFHTDLIPITDEETQRRFEKMIIQTALEDALTSIFEEHDNNATDYFVEYVRSLQISNNSYIHNIIAGGLTVVCMIIATYTFSKLRTKQKKGNYNVRNKIVDPIQEIQLDGIQYY
ncbi:gp134R [Rabbit fibroma virus]|uniref:Gp134R n=1 Tax=Rabbit fibroma virus (strain Kasza) TaxID=10272 RepID=Q9Q8U4_RFVKA|nr:gp134R [Rabbit fibroma virus]AAF18017.1 gp134R [Rabbit fibroma virus]